MGKETKFDLESLIRRWGRYDIAKVIANLPNHPGDSYVLDYWKLVAQAKKLKCPEVHLLNYIVLASFRSRYDYITYGDNTLAAELCPLSDDQIILNPFINRYGQKIHFLLEPGPAGRK